MRRPTLIIAEAGVNHNGDLGLARLMVEKAAEAGADFVKFQTFKASKLVSRRAEKAAYQEENARVKGESQLQMIERLELDAQAHRQLIAYCKDQRIEFLSTGFDEESLDLLDKLGIPLFKIPSGEITNLPYLRKVASMGRPVILSTGMANLGEIEAALSVLSAGNVAKENITILHCNTEYPTPMEDVNLRAMDTLGQAFGVNVGYSDHTLGIEVAIAAVARGAVCIEKHFTLDRNMEGPDHRASLLPHELKAMVDGIRNIEKALGSSVKASTPSESKNLLVARKSIHLARSIAKGKIIQREDLAMLRPGDGISPMEVDKIVGKKALADLREGAKLDYGDYS